MVESSAPVPVHPGVHDYEFERKQVLQNTIVKLLERLASVLGGIVGVILAIYGYFRYRRLLRFEYYFHEIRNIESIGRGKLADPTPPRSAARCWPICKIASPTCATPPSPSLPRDACRERT